MVFEIAEGVGNGHLWWWMALPVALLALTIWATGETDAGEVVAAWVLTVFSFILVPILVMIGIDNQASAQEEEHKEAALVELGFENVDYDSGDFTASLDGDYFSGALVNLGDNTFQVIEKVAK